MLLAGCMGSDSASSTTSSLRQVIVSTTAETVADAGQEVVLSVEDSYSSFQSKDPFIQQQVPTTEATNTSETSTSPPTSSTTTTTARRLDDDQLDLDYQHEQHDIHHRLLVHAYASGARGGCC